MTRAELASRADMVEGYVAYLEEHPAQLGAAELLRVASALELTPSVLLGVVDDSSPGRGDAAAYPKLDVLAESECWALIGERGVGRIVLYAEGGQAPVVLPLNYATVGHELFVETRIGHVVQSTIERSGGRSIASFEVDRIDEVQHAGWSVLLRGEATMADASDTAGTAVAAPHPWIGTEGTVAVRIKPHEITGRRINPG